MSARPSSWPARAPSSGCPPTPRFCSRWGRLVQTKGHPRRSPPCARSCKRRPRAHLLIAGSGPLDGELRAAADKLDGRVRLLGQRRDLPCLYGIADGFLFATHYEGLSLALVELISAGLPGAISDIPPNREVADGLPTIQFFPVGDVARIAERGGDDPGGRRGAKRARADRSSSRSGAASRPTGRRAGARGRACSSARQRSLDEARAVRLAHRHERAAGPLAGGAVSARAVARGLAHRRGGVRAGDRAARRGRRRLARARRRRDRLLVDASQPARTRWRSKLRRGGAAPSCASLHARSRARPRIVHARSHLPASVALALTQHGPALAPAVRLPRPARRRIRRRRPLARRIVSISAGQARRADAVRARRRRRHLDRAAARAGCAPSGSWPTTQTTVEVIPCCVDLDRFDADEADPARARAAARRRRPLRARLFGHRSASWYCEEQMARLFAALRRRRPSLFAVFTRSPSERLRAALRAAGVPESRGAHRERRAVGDAGAAGGRRRGGQLHPALLLQDGLVADQGRRVPGARPAGGAQPRRRRSRSRCCAHDVAVDAGSMGDDELDAPRRPA